VDPDRPRYDRQLRHSLCQSHPEPTFLLNGTPVPVVEETKFLGVIFDRKLSFIPHIKHLKDKCIQKL